MTVLTRCVSIAAAAALVLAGEETWRNKKAAEWTVDEAHQILTESPWAKRVTPAMVRTMENGPRRGGGGGGGMGRGGGINLGGIGVQLPGTGRRGGGPMGSPGGGYPPQGAPREEGEERQAPPELTVRWESAPPVREAELKARETNAPSIDANYYTVAVYGVPRRAGALDPQQLRKQVSLKVEGKKAWKLVRVDVLQREDGAVLLYLFSRNNEVTKNDKRIEFKAQIGRMEIAPSFELEDMTHEGKLQL